MEIQEYLKSENKSYEIGIQLYKENAKFNLYEPIEKWVRFFESNIETQKPQFQKMLEQRLIYILGFIPKKKVEILEEFQPETITEPEQILPEEPEQVIPEEPELSKEIPINQNEKTTPKKKPLPKRRR